MEPETKDAPAPDWAGDGDTPSDEGHGLTETLPADSAGWEDAAAATGPDQPTPRGAAGQEN